MFERRWVQLAAALTLFLLPLLLALRAPQGEAAGVWSRGEFAKVEVTHLVIGSHDESVIRYAALAGRGVFRNTEDFYFWASKNDGLPKSALGRIEVRGLAASRQNALRVYLASANGGIYRTVNGGALWTLVSRELAGVGEAVALSPVDDLTLYVVVGGRLYRGQDIPYMEGSWSLLSALPEDRKILSLALDPLDIQRVYVGTAGGGLFWSDDGGMSWMAGDESLVATDILTILVIPLPGGAPDERLIYLGTDRGLYALVGRDELSAAELLWGGRRIHALATDSAHPQMLYAGVARWGVHRSDDGGRHWEEMHKGLGGASVYALAFDPARPQELYAATSDGVWRCQVPALAPVDTPVVAPEPTTTATQTPSEPTATATTAATATATATVTPQDTATAEPTATATASITPQATATTEPTATPTAAVTPQATATVSATPSPIRPPTHTPARARTNTPAPPTRTPSPTSTLPPPATNTPMPPTNTPAPPATNTPLPPPTR